MAVLGNSENTDTKATGKMKANSSVSGSTSSSAAEDEVTLESNSDSKATIPGLNNNSEKSKGSESSSSDTILRTSKPSSLKQLNTLLQTRVQIERKSKLTVCFRLFLAPLLTLLYSSGNIGSDPPPKHYLDVPFVRKPSFDLEDFGIDVFLSSNVYPPKGYELGKDAPDRIELNSNSSRLLVAYDGQYINGSLISDIKNILVQDLNIPFDQLALQPLMDIEDFKDVCEDSFENEDAIAGIYFHRSSPSWRFGIYLNEAFAPSVQVDVRSNPDHTNAYLSSGFVAIQTAFEQAITLYEAQKYNITTSSNTTSIDTSIFPDVKLGQELPYSDVVNDEDIDWLLLWLPGFFLLLGAMPFVMQMINSMMYEKISNFVRAFNLVGVKTWVYWLHWYILFCVGTILTTFIFVGVWYAANYSVYSSFGFVWLWMQLSMWGLVAFALVVVSFTMDEDSSNMIGFLSTMAFAVIYIPILLYDVHIAIQSTLTVLCPLFGAMQGAAMFAKWGTGYGRGVTVETYKEAGGPQLLFAQLVSLAVWSTWGLIYRIDAPKKHRLQLDPNNVLNDNEVTKVASGAYDVVLRVKGLVKVFYNSQGDEIKAVNGLDMEIYRNQVYGFLGHNGGGKSTTVSMISAEFPPTAGDIDYYFEGRHIKLSTVGDLSEIQGLVGVCPQENILFDDLTCEEHLLLFAKLKGNITTRKGLSESEAISEEVIRRMHDVRFTSTTDKQKPVGQFSGGMKRKVAIAIAMIGNPEVLMLDEPTAGMDPYSRRLVWDMINKAKRGRSIMLTTHFMDEADILSDRIGIINKGRIVASGTSLSLKHEFGAGYHLKFRPPQPENIHGITFQEITDEIKRRIPGSLFDCSKEGVFYFKLTYEETKFPDLLEWLDSKGCSDISLQLTTLEEVFLRTGAETHEQYVKADKDQLLADECLPINLENKSEESERGARVGNVNLDSIKDIWKSRFRNPGTMTRIWAVTILICKGSLRQIGFIIFNIIMPLILLMVGFVSGKLIPPPDLPHEESVRTLSLGTNVITDFITNPVIFQYPVPIDTTRYNISYTAQVPDFEQDNFTHNNVGGFVRASTLGFNSTVEPAISILISALTNATLSNLNLSMDLNFGVELELNNVKIGEWDLAGEVINISNLFVPMFTNLGLLPMSYCILTVIMLKEDGVMANLRIMGVTKAQSYLAVVLSRYMFFFAPVFTMSVFFGLALQSPVMGDGGRWLGFILLLIAYGYALVPFSLLFTPLFKSKKSAQNIFPPVWNLANLFPFIIYFALLSIPRFVNLAILLGDIFSLVPPFAYQRAVSNLISLDPVLNQVDDPLEKWRLVWSWKARIWWSILLMFGIGTMSWVILWYQVGDSSVKCSRTSLERGEKIDLERTTGEILSISHLVKTFMQVPSSIKKSLRYKSRFLQPQYWFKRIVGGCADPYRNEYRHVRVTNDVSFGLSSKEDLVLVGPSGAGKTVLTKMILGEILPDSGFVLKGNEVINFTKEYENGFMGYCPQFDAFMSKKLTVEEQVDAVTRIRGMGPYKYGENEEHKHIDVLLGILGLDQHIAKFSENLSGGYKRKLSLAIAVISRPEVCIFDEPTTGVDPGARHEIWNLLNPTGREEIDLPAIIMSTHDMAEAEALATNVAILIDGELIAKGSIPELIEKHCTFFFIEVTTDIDTADAAVALVLEMFPQASLVDSIQGRIKIKVPHDSNQVTAHHMGMIFREMETLKSLPHSPISYYSVAEMTLEQIFIALSKEKFDEPSDAETPRRFSSRILTFPVDSDSPTNPNLPTSIETQ